MNTPPAKKRENNPLTQRSSFKHWAHENVRFSDTDMQGHVNNTAFAMYTETGRSNFVQNILPIVGTEQNALFVLARLTLSYLDELHWPAMVDIGTGIVSLGKSSFILGHGLFVGERCIATAESVLVCIDDTSRSSRAIPDSIKQHFAGFEIPAMV